MDPLFLRPPAGFSPAEVLGDRLTYNIRTPDAQLAEVTVQFSLLPVAELANLPNAEKQRIGITRGAGVSFVRAGREIDYGWRLLGQKRKENYDDWWRCEVRFEPVADELFGITHAKQVIRPTPALVDALAPDLEAIARLLNSRVRKAFTEMKHPTGPPEHNSQRQVRRSPEEPPAEQKREQTTSPQHERPGRGQPFAMIERRALPDGHLVDYAYKNGRLQLFLGESHPFTRRLVDTLDAEDRSPTAQVRLLELLLLAFAQADVQTLGGAQSRESQALRREWAQAVAALLDGHGE